MLAVHDGLLAAVAAVGSDVVLRALAAADAVLVALATLTVVVVLGRGALGHAVRAIAHVLTGGAVLGVRSGAGAVALLVTRFAILIVRLVDSVIDFLIIFLWDTSLRYC